MSLCRHQAAKDQYDWPYEDPCPDCEYLKLKLKCSLHNVPIVETDYCSEQFYTHCPICWSIEIKSEYELGSVQFSASEQWDDLAAEDIFDPEFPWLMQEGFVFNE